MIDLRGGERNVSNNYMNGGAAAQDVPRLTSEYIDSRVAEWQRGNQDDHVSLGGTKAVRIALLKSSAPRANR